MGGCMHAYCCSVCVHMGNDMTSCTGIAVFVLLFLLLFVLLRLRVNVQKGDPHPPFLGVQQGCEQTATTTIDVLRSESPSGLDASRFALLCFAPDRSREIE